MAELEEVTGAKARQVDHAVLVLPFTCGILHNPAIVTSVILSALPESGATATFTVLFTPPIAASGSTSPGRSEHRLYTQLLTSPRKHFTTFQSFLCKVYAALASAQVKAGRILLDVEVHFHEQAGNREHELPRWGRADADHDCMVLIPSNHTLPEELGSMSGQSNIHHLDALAMPTPSPSAHPPSPPAQPKPGPSVVAVGGTFDHLHAAHKLLLHLSFFLAKDAVIVGIMADSMLAGKSNAGLVQPIAERQHAVEQFLYCLGGRLAEPGEEAFSLPPVDPSQHTLPGAVRIAAGEITDALGPTGYEPNIQALVVSRETLSGGSYVNKVRREKGLDELEMFVVDVIAQGGEELEGVDDEKVIKELKMGSTGIRKWIAENGREVA